MDLNTDVGVAIFATKKALENLLKTDKLFAMVHLKLRLDHLTNIIHFLRFLESEKFPCVGRLLKENSKASTNSFYESYKKKL